MFNYFPAIGSKGKDVQGLLKNSITLLGKDSDVFKPVVYMTIIKSVSIFAIFSMMYLFFVAHHLAQGFLVLLFLICFAPIVSYLNMKYKAITSWMIYDILRGKDTDVSAGAKELKGLGFTLFLYAMIDHIVKSATSSQSQEESGIVSMIKGLILSVFQEVWDLIKNFSLPAIVIDKTTLKEIPAKLKLVKQNIPGALAGILGIDIIGSVFISLFGAIQIPAILISGGIGYFGQDFLPSAWTMTFGVDNAINLLPVFAILFITSVFVSFLNSLVQLVKTTYFTSFYVSITRPSEIVPDIRSEVTSYLNFNDRMGDYTFFKKEIPKEEKAYELDEETGEDLAMIRKIASTFTKNTAKGLSEKKIYTALLKKGYDKGQLQAGVRMHRSEKKAA
jgi:hypothetical protein